MTTTRHRLLATAAAIATAAGLATALAVPAQAKSSPTGDFAVTIGTTTYNPAPGRSVKVTDLAARSRIVVKGIHVAFTIDPSTLGVYDYTLTGAPDPERMVTRPTVVFASKVPVLTAAQIGTARVQKLEVKDETLVATLSAAAGTLKIQAKDAPAGGIFQMEPEMGAAVEVVHTLGPSLFYFSNPFTGKVNFGDGLDPVAAGSAASHQMLLGKDSPQVATKLFQDATTTRWSVTSGGRMGGVLGEDAIELSAGATSCTSKCQAQNRVRGSLPVPPLPTDPTPLG
ncbi:hypothetical protein [Solicola sp. PLA-1-18]|uniref:hypothetical protein n=1 Tax=Solicola sp. PLA-1-18 TaxID=3380532 RepID=UPI003B77B55E